MNTLYIYCAGGFGREVMDIARRRNTQTGQWDAIHFIDDICTTETRYGARVYNFASAVAWLRDNPGEVIIANGEPAARADLRGKLEAENIRLGSLIDLSTIVADTAQIADGAVITPMCSISSDAVLGRNVSVNTMSIIGHDVVVGENTVISSMVNIGGRTRIGRNSYIGMGALIKDGLAIGENVIIGMGSVVYNDVADGLIALGNPARPARPNVDQKVFR